MSQHPDNDEILRRIDALAADADHTDDEAREALREHGVNPDALVRSARDHAQTILALDRLADRNPSTAGRGRRDPFRYWVLGVAAAVAAVTTAIFHYDLRADAAA